MKGFQMNHLMKCSWLFVLTACLTSGCVTGSSQLHRAWPWSYDNDYDQQQTGNHISVSGDVATFGDAPSAAKPVAQEALSPPTPDSKLHSDMSASPLPSSLSPAGATGASDGKAAEYDFRVADAKSERSSYLPEELVHSGKDITAANHGNAPVTVQVEINADASHNVRTDRSLPLVAVLGPNTDQQLVHIEPESRNTGYKFNYRYSWSLGDYTAKHNCPEGYLLPFKEGVSAYVSVSEDKESTPYTRYAVGFSLPAGTPVLAARKGTVVRIKNDRIDVLHDDATIGTYCSMGSAAKEVVVGKTVTAGDILGEAQGSERGAYVQLTVWRPQLTPTEKGFEPGSFQLQFCSTGSNSCRVFNHDEALSADSPLKKRIKTRKKKAAS